MEASEIFGLTLLSIVVLFLTIGTIFFVVDVYKERRKKMEKLLETKNTRFERIEKNAEEMNRQMRDTNADFVCQLIKMDRKCDHMFQHITERYEHETPEEYGKVDNRKINSQYKSLLEEVGKELLKEIIPKCKECDEKMHKGCMCCIETVSKQIKEVCHLSEE